MASGARSGFNYPASKMKPSITTLLFPVVMFVLALLLTGCLVSEREAYHMTLNTDGKSGMLVFTKYNIQSNASDSAGQDKDFQELIHNWKSDQYLLEQADHGAYVKERDVHLDNGKVVWREQSIFSDVSRIFPEIHPADTVRFSFDSKETDVSETNGSVSQKGDSTIVAWPPNTREFTLITAAKGFSTTSNLEQRFAAYLEKTSDHLKKFSYKDNDRFGRDNNGISKTHLLHMQECHDDAERNGSGLRCDQLLYRADSEIDVEKIIEEDGAPRARYPAHKRAGL